MEVQSSSQIVTINKPTPTFLQAGCPFCHPTNSVKALQGKLCHTSLAATVTYKMKTMWIILQSELIFSSKHPVCLVYYITRLNLQNHMLTKCSPTRWAELQFWSAVWADNMPTLALHDRWQSIVEADRTLEQWCQIWRWSWNAIWRCCWQQHIHHITYTA